MYKAVFIDIDGTLRSDKKIITDRVKKSIEKIKSLGILVILCTGRPRSRTIQFANECNSSRYIITSGGSEVFDMDNNQVIYSNTISIEKLLEINEIVERYNLIYYLNSGETRAVNHKIRLYGNEIIINDAKEFISKNNIQQVVLNSDKKETMLNVEKDIKKIKGLKIANHSRCLDDDNLPTQQLMYCDVVEENTSKGNAIVTLLKHLGIKKEETIGIGDNQNDISMFEEVGFKVAMGNGIEELKEKSDIIVGTNEEDGVAIFLEGLYIKQKGN